MIVRSAVGEGFGWRAADRWRFGWKCPSLLGWQGARQGRTIKRRCGLIARTNGSGFQTSITAASIWCSSRKCLLCSGGLGGRGWAFAWRSREIVATHGGAGAFIAACAQARSPFAQAQITGCSINGRGGSGRGSTVRRFDRQVNRAPDVATPRNCRRRQKGEASKLQTHPHCTFLHTQL